MSETIPKIFNRRRGAQPGNTNALRHGIYSRQFSESARPIPDENLQDELLRELVLVVLNIASLVLSLKERIIKESQHE
jgi:hypothetical protein